VIEGAAVAAISANHFERRAVPDEVIDRLHPGGLFCFCSLCQERMVALE
jgi:hypothetical protein